MVDVSPESLVATAMFFSYLPCNNLRAAKDWKQAFVDTERNFLHNSRSIAAATTVAQLESKLWVIEELQALKIEPKVVGILAGWYDRKNERKFYLEF
jgi:hypothetical protein